jgi:glyoxylate carboligase
VALVTSGPGVTNAVTGIATAYMDSIPMVIITGQVPTAYIGQDAFQEVDTVGITRPCVKHNFLVKDVRDLANHQEGLLPRQDRPARPGAGRHSEGHLGGEVRVRLSEDRSRCAPTTR